MVIGAAVLLFIASFLDFYSYDCGGYPGCSGGINGWKGELFPVLPGIFLTGIIGAALIVGARFLPPRRDVLGLSLEQWGTALATVAAWSSLWTIIGGPQGADTGVGQILALIATLVMAGTVLASSKVPALKAPLVAAGGPPSPPFGTTHPGQPGGYGYPGAQQPGGVQPGGYGYPGAGAPGQPSYGGAQSGQPTQPGAEQQATAQPGGAEFAPFWFAVPVARPLYGEDGAPTPIAELAPGTWYLAVEQRGAALVAQTQDGRRGVLQDTSGIQRG